MAVKIFFAFALLALSIFLISRRFKLLKIIGIAGLILWLFLGDWGGLELAKKLFLFVKHNMLLSLEIFGGIIVGIVVLGWILGKLTPKSKARPQRKISIAPENKPNGKPAHKTVYIVDGIEFSDHAFAIQNAKQFHPDNPLSFIRIEHR